MPVTAARPSPQSKRNPRPTPKPETKAQTQTQMQTSADTDAAAVAAAIGEPARARMLFSLLDGRARTHTELAVIAEVAPSTATVHLQRLQARRLVRVVPQGRHRYYSLEGPEVAAALEALSVIAGRARTPFQPTTPAYLHAARTCYDHIAGRLGVALHDRLTTLGWLTPSETPARTGHGDRSVRHAHGVHDTRGVRAARGSRGADRAHDAGDGRHARAHGDGRVATYDVTSTGAVAFAALGIDIDETRAHRRRFAYACLDWSERRPHLGGALASALLRTALARTWIERDLDSRALTITPLGRRELTRRFGLDSL